MDNLPQPTNTNEIADTLRAVSQQVDAHRATRTPDTTAPTYTLEYQKALRQISSPIQYHRKLLKHLTPIWQEGITHWKQILHKSVDGHTPQLFIQRPEALHALLPSGDNRKPTQSLHTALHTLREILLTPTNTERRTLPNSTHTHTTQIHFSWIPHLPVDDIPILPTPGYTNITSHNSRHRGRPHIPTDSLTHEHYLVPSDTLDTPFDILEITSQRTIIHQTTYLVSQWSPEILTQR